MSSFLEGYCEHIIEKPSINRFPHPVSWKLKLDTPDCPPPLVAYVDSIANKFNRLSHDNKFLCDSFCAIWY